MIVWSRPPEGVNQASNEIVDLAQTRGLWQCVVQHKPEQRETSKEVTCLKPLPTSSSSPA